MRDYFEFFRQFRQRFETTGAILPSSRFLARAMTAPLRQRNGPARILEVGPGTGAITRQIVRLLQPADHFDLVEINDRFAALLHQRFESDRHFQRVKERSAIHHCPLQEFESEQPYDFIISGLPLNNFSPALVQEIFDSFFRLLSPDGVLSYFEYMFVRSLRKRIGRRTKRDKLRQLDELLNRYLRDHRFRRDWVFLNIPPAWVQHLRDNNEGHAVSCYNTGAGNSAAVPDGAAADDETR